ncbi:hypothetical protein EIP91_003712 [Steccherinum ochraceum]|uniref:Uncharacterized protein n=1 Tax=Steccherinum ochraceum TaxID=92696 RepID=A0A4R0RNI8_9APHY|nr:hypothetical protein EIP91_003712 [Steccherinum ochraceum]
MDEFDEPAEKPPFPWHLLRAATIQRIVQDLHIKYAGLHRAQLEDAVRVVENDGLAAAYIICGRVVPRKRRRSSLLPPARDSDDEGLEGSTQEYDTTYETDYHEQDEVDEVDQLVISPPPKPPPKRRGRPPGSRNKPKVKPVEEPGDMSLSAGEMTNYYTEDEHVHDGPSYSGAITQDEHEASGTEVELADDLDEPSAAPAPRKRGRPRKIQPEAGPSNQVELAEEDELAGPSEPQQVKKKGRPPGLRAVEVLVPDPLPAVTPKRRGRPPKNPQAANTATPASAPKRRGRPPKKRPEDDTYTPASSAPKKRGRPPSKAPKSTDARPTLGDETDGEVAPPKRRGRPPSRPPQPKSSNDDDDAENAEAGPSSVVSVPKKRGRPPSKPRPVEVEDLLFEPTRRTLPAPLENRLESVDALLVNVRALYQHKLIHRSQLPKNKNLNLRLEPEAGPSIIADPPAAAAEALKVGPPRKKRGRPPGVRSKDASEADLNGIAEKPLPKGGEPEETSNTAASKGKGKEVVGSRTTQEAAGASSGTQHVEEEAGEGGGEKQPSDAPKDQPQQEKADDNIFPAPDPGAIAGGSSEGGGSTTDAPQRISNSVPVWTTPKMVVKTYGRRRSVGA